MKNKVKTVPEMDDQDYLKQVDILAEQVRMLALNLAINLARNKDDLKDLTFMEPEFTKLINGSVEVIKQISDIMRAFRNEDKMAYSTPRADGGIDRIEASLNDILKISQQVLHNISEMKKRKSKISKYKK